MRALGWMLTNSGYMWNTILFLWLTRIGLAVALILSTQFFSKSYMVSDYLHCTTSKQRRKCVIEYLPTLTRQITSNLSRRCRHHLVDEKYPHEIAGPKVVFSR